MTESVATKARRFVDAKRKKDKLGIAFDKAEAEFKRLQAELWVAIEATEQKSGTWDLGPGYGTVQLTRRATTTGIVLNKEEAEKALEELGEEFLGNREVRKKVLNDHLRDCLKTGKPLPKGVDFNTRRYLTTTIKKDK